ncbi:MAG: phosphohistidine phosphatase SixA [Synechococcales cyanobacterium T60_A2020_003]|nr:phosphohistidine phosphatase SixA [Synechococcales cyanobacterium T60_A2020_003]
MTVDLYLIRHGIAAERGTYAQDGDRPLTPAGQQRTTAVAKRLSDFGLRFDLILTSPLIRARQTAEILREAKLSSTLTESRYLEPEGDFDAWCQWFRSWATEQIGVNPSQKPPSLALVGHEPDLGEWAERLVWGEPRHRLIVKKAGIIGIEVTNPDQPVGTSDLFWLSPPRLLL